MENEKQRISRVVTRSGDGGETGLADGSRVSKSHPRIDALGGLDELNSLLGVLRARALDPDLDGILEQVQQDLFDMGGELAIPGHRSIDEDDLAWLDSTTATLNDALPPLREFVLPGGHPDAAWCHHCRTQARRLERQLITLQEHSPDALNPTSRALANRLSDLLFVTARLLNQRNNTPEPQWQPKQKRNSC